MNLTIYSRKLGKPLNYSRPGSYYIYVDLNDEPGCLGRQICDGGHLTGSTIAVHGNENNSAVKKEFERVCRKWHKRYITQSPNIISLDAILDAIDDYWAQEIPF